MQFHLIRGCCDSAKIHECPRIEGGNLYASDSVQAQIGRRQAVAGKGWKGTVGKFLEDPWK